MNIPDLYRIFLNNPSIETDTRKLKKGDIFFALRGPNFNGNNYAETALKAGASYCVCDEYPSFTHEKIILVEDCLATLQKLAGYHRKQFTIPFIAITGSNGKTTTKELVSEVLSTIYITYTTEGNLNNHIGIPLTLLRVKPDAEIAVIEMGANHQKEIEGYCTYAMPTHGIITNIGKAHLEGFGGEEGVRKGKGELFDYIRNHAGTAFINADYDYLLQMSNGIKTISFGEKNADVTGTVINDSTYLEIGITAGADIPSIKTKLVGSYNLNNVLTAVTVGKTFQVPDNKIKVALENYFPTNSRSQLIEKQGNKIIMDAYNANPSSMKSAIENFSQMSGENKILILGTMMELGESSIHEHYAIVKLISEYSWFKVVLVGNDYTNLPENFIHFANALEAREWFKTQHFNDVQILVKGSRSMQMEKVVE